MDAKTALPWLATFFCLSFSFRIAMAFLRGNPRMFTVMALFTCAWGLLLPYYHEATIPASAELFAAHTGFLFVYVGGLVMLQAQIDYRHGDNNHIVPWQITGLVLLLVIATPSLPKIDTPSWKFDFFGVRDQLQLTIGTVLDIVGFFAIAIGIKRLLGNKPFAAIAVILVPYGLLDVGYTIDVFSQPAPRLMSPLYAYGFAISKVAFTLVFGCLVAHYGMPDNVRAAGPVNWIQRFFGINAA
jgi:hypothetical protein